MTEVADTPTHRLAITQVSLQRFAAWLDTIRANRAAIVEKITRAKNNKKLSRTAEVHKQLARTFKRLDTKLTQSDKLIADAADILNQARGLFLELSDGEVVFKPVEMKSGGPETSEGHRGEAGQCAAAPSTDRSDMPDDGATEGAAPTDDGAGITQCEADGASEHIDTEDRVQQ